MSSLSLYKGYLFVFVIVSLILGIIDLGNFDSFLLTRIPQAQTTDLNYWQSLSAIGTFLAVVVAMVAIQESNKSLERQITSESFPLVIIFDQVGCHKDKEGNIQKIFPVKNIGKGAGRNICISLNERFDRNGNPIETDVIHTFDLGSGDDFSYFMSSEAYNKITSNDSFQVFIKYQDIICSKTYITKCYLEKMTKVYDSYLVVTGHETKELIKDDKLPFELTEQNKRR